MIVIIDYGMGNLRSVQKAVMRVGLECLISREPGVIRHAQKLILPGVGHFRQGMENLKKFELINVLNELVHEKKIPILGICLGMQLMTDYSEEGDCPGLGWIKALTKKFVLQDQKIPHIGWNTLLIKKQTKLFDQLNEKNEFYFVHSYYVQCQNPNEVICQTNYGIDFDSGFAKENIYGFQFHPEKSHKSGLTLLKNVLM